MTTNTTKSDTTTNTITLTPGNWLYNAGVIGFLRVLLEEGQITEQALYESMLAPDGSCKLSLNVFGQIDVEKLHFSTQPRKELKIRGKNTYHPNYWQSSWGGAEKFQPFVRALLNLKTGKPCDFCNVGYKIEDRDLLIAQGVPQRFLETINIFTSQILAIKIGPALSEMPNSAWNMFSTIFVCDLCAYILLYTPISLINTSNHEQIFINAPSFHVMWHLNNYARQMLSRTSSAREILGLSLIEYTIQTQKQIHGWTAHNVEVVVKRRVEVERGKYDDKIEFVQLPAEVVMMLNNSRVASLLKELKELTILNKVLDMQFDWLLESAQRVLRIAIKDQDNISDNDTKFINKIFPYLYQKEELYNLKKKETRKKLTELSHKMLLLYSVIKESLAKSTAHV